jgi:large subunit ribosomal protein L27
MAHKKAGGSTSYGRDSVSKRLGVKLFGGQKIEPGNIIVRQHGSKFRAGKNVRIGGDGTLYSLASGHVKFSKKQVKRFTGALEKTRIVNVVTE